MLDGFFSFELAGLDSHRALDPVDKGREAGCFLPVKPTGGRIKSPNEQSPPVGKIPASVCLREEEETGHWLSSMFKWKD